MKFVSAPVFSDYQHQIVLDCLVGKVLPVSTFVNEPAFFGSKTRRQHAFTLVNTHFAVAVEDFQALFNTLDEGDRQVCDSIIRKLHGQSTIILFPQETLRYVDE
jgi:hypothetical protein